MNDPICPMCSDYVAGRSEEPCSIHPAASAFWRAVRWRRKITCHHCGTSETTPKRHICKRATWDWSRLADPQLYGHLLPYTPTMRLHTERTQLKVQES